MSQTERKSAEDYQHLLKHGHFPGEPKPSKYGNTKVKWGGHTFDSKWELERYMELLALEAEGKIFVLERQIPIVLQPKFERPNGEVVKSIRYVCDFSYREPRNHGLSDIHVYEDAKGMETDVFKLKWKMLKWLHRNHTDVAMRLSRKQGKTDVTKKKRHQGK